MMIYERFPRQFQRLGGFTYKQDIIQGLANIPGYRPRRSGTTTALAVRTIAIALQHPGTPVVITDHHGTQQMDMYLADMIRRMVYRMELKRITVRKTGPASPCVVFHPDREEL